MQIQEYKIEKDIEIKFLRLNKPTEDILNFPLSGLYQDTNKTETNEIQFFNKFSNFGITDNYLGIDNLFSLNTTFGKIFLNERLDGLIIFSNKSDNDIIMKDLEIIIIIKEKEQKKTLNQRLPPEGIKLPKRQSYTIKMSLPLEHISKYDIDINLRTKCRKYDDDYNILKLKGFVKLNAKEISVINNSIELIHNKRLTFDVNPPFKININFHNYQMDLCYIEAKIKNVSIYPLTIYDIFLEPKLKTYSKISDFLSSDIEINNKLPLVQPIEEIIKEENNNFINNGIDPNSKSKYMTLEPEEEISLLFRNDKPNIFQTETKFIVQINWLNLFDTCPKKFEYEFDNKLNIYNDYFILTIEDKPKKDIIYNQNFQVIFKLDTKYPEKNYKITLIQELLDKNDKSSDREIEIIDIVEKEIELNKDKLSGNFTLICKSDIVGYVYLPSIKFSISENNKKVDEQKYQQLLFFNCVEE